MNETITDRREQRQILERLIRYCLPLIAANLLQSLYSLTDFFFAGRFIGDEALSAISNGGQIMALYTGIIIGLSNGGNVMIGQYTGSKMDKKRDECACCFLLLFILLGVASTLILGSCHSIFANWLKAPSPILTGEYLLYCAPGALAISGYNAITASLRAIGDSKRPLMFVVISVTSNIILDILLMYVFRLGVRGAAIATALSQYIAFIISLCYISFSKKRELRFKTADLRLSTEYTGYIFKIGFPCAIQMTVASISWLSVIFLLNRYGVAVSAAYGASAKIKDLIQTVTAALSMAATSLIAQELGAARYGKALSIMKEAMKSALVFSAGMVIIVEIFAPQLVAAFSSGPDVIKAGTENLRIEILGQFFYASFMIYHAMMTGAGHTKTVLFSSFVNCILVRSVLAVALSSIQALGATGVYIACFIAPSSSIPIGACYIRKGAWKRSLIQS